MRRIGGLISGGASPSWTSTSTSGIFSLVDNLVLKAANQWPRGPAAPTGLTASAGTAQLSLSWTAPTTTYGTITNYLVEYTPSGGSAQYVLTGSTSTSYTLTGLTNGTSYSVRVAAVNFTAGDWSGTATGLPTTFTPAAVVLTSGTSYAIPQGATQMKAWAIGGGSGGSEAPDGGGGRDGVPSAVGVRTFLLSGGSVSYSIGGPGLWSRGCEGQGYGGTTTVTHGGVSVSGRGGSPAYCGGGNLGCVNATVCGTAGNDVDGLFAAVSLSGGSLGLRGRADQPGAAVLYFT